MIKSRKSRFSDGLGGVILSLSLICVAVISYTSITRFPLIVFAGPVIVWLIFFWIGVFLSRRERDYKIGKIFIGVLLSFVLMLIETKYRHEATGGGYGIKPSSFIFSFLMILLLFSKRIEHKYVKDKVINKALIVVGDYSFSIYLIPCFVITIVFHFVTISNWIVRWTIVVAITMLFICLVRKVLPNKCLKIIGF